jgi:hypothetical protein
MSKMSVLRRYSIALLGSAAALTWAHTASAADLLLDPTPIAESDAALPAVSGPNGKFELYGGLVDGSGAWRAAGSISVPVGDRFGVQGDFMFTQTGTGPVWSGAVHAFTRDPDSYLLGVTAGVVVSSDARLTAIGPEAELYMDRMSLTFWGGWASIDYASSPPADMTGLFAFGDIVYYPTDNLALTMGGSTVLGENKLHLGAEYLFQDAGLPLSAAADARFNGTSNTFMVGLKGYIGGDPGKSLIDRHRQDDPPNRANDLANGSSDLMSAPATGTSPEDNQEVCEDYGGYWNGDWCEFETGPGSTTNELGCAWLDETYGSPYIEYYWNGSECLYSNYN